MGSKPRGGTWQPVSQTERYAALDILRGLALFGVLMVNLLGDFRVSLEKHIQIFHTHPGWADRAVDVLVAGLLEFKAVALFSLLFGTGMAVFADRASAHNADAARFLARRFVILLALGLCHLLFIWNGDILTLYAVSGLLLVPLIRLPAAVLVPVGIVAFTVSFILPLGFLWPGDETLSSLAAEAADVYSKGGFGDVLAFHWRETRLLIVPLLTMVLPKTWSLMVLGAAAWRAGILADPQRHRVLLWTVVIIGGGLGGSATVLWIHSLSTNIETTALVEACSSTPLALAYASAILLALRSPRAVRLAAPFAAAGQMALTNYLVQSVVLSLLFYDYGLGLFGLRPVAALGVGVIIYIIQLAGSAAWLRRFRFGPVEWLWRTLTYGRRQPLRRSFNS